MTTKIILDATRPVGRPFAARLEEPKEALKKTKLEDFIPPPVLTELLKH